MKKNGTECLGDLIGVDVGGTFTDLIKLDQNTGKVRLAKVASTIENQAFGVMQSIAEAETNLKNVALVVHGTTTTTNAVLERKLSRTGLITTAGFRDVLELGRRTRPQPYGMKGHFLPIIPRDLRLEVGERMDYAGRILIPLNESSVREAGKKLLDQGVESVVVHFLHAYANPEHELRAAEVLAEFWPNEYITTGHSLLSESREFERGVTAAVNAAVQPILKRYINKLDSELEAEGYAGELLVMNGNGGTVSAKRVIREAAKTVMSGPASGVIAAAYTGTAAGRPNLITYDMGGTSTDVALIRGGEPSVSNEIELEYAMPIHVPMVDVRTIGAGGGSIAKVNDAGLLEVGPHSAGAEPGPICYGRGGNEPTISDANFLLGRLDVTKLKSVSQEVDIEHIRSIFQEKLGDPLNIDAETAAAALLQVAITRMAGATRMVSVSLGEDPRDFSLFAFGGAGPMHATALARELGIPEVIVPARPGITNALGCVVADMKHDFVRTVNSPLNNVDMDEIIGILKAQSKEGTELIQKEPVSVEEIKVVHSFDMQFVGQTHILSVFLPTYDLSHEVVQSAFDEAYYGRFRVRLPEIRAQIVNVKTTVMGRRTGICLDGLIDASGRVESLEMAQNGARPVWFNGDWQNTKIFNREALPLSAKIKGPAILEQMDTMVLIEPGDEAISDKNGNILISLGGLS
ncbi:MAG: hydantoinase/oxoprolinase family protein [Pseudomonadota bacterium]|nr:hydantoinase/oxoprolinase family protein [Pseudomonadota bacterium]MEC8752665.1 hydantoinase/oxoprolinase family protein [Pseudomonadota bacterium]MEE3007586.1 hydantoinase/oxoprolinase family protein [Pseudomonadota bacterium]|tara:strand:- start:686 stop:2755 length:2070 start_codon:yes stop_codon:yes gene_type:complete